MPWMKVDDGLDGHRKVDAVPNAAMGLWVKAGAWTSRNGTDGFVPTRAVRKLGTLAQAKQLVAAGLWTGHPDGFEFHDWLTYNPPASWWAARREADRDRKRDVRSGGRDGHPEEPKPPAVPPDVRADTARNPTQTAPGNTTESPSESAGIPQHVRSAPSPSPTPKGSGEGEGFTTEGGEVPLPQEISRGGTQVTRERARGTGPQAASGEPPVRCPQHANVAGAVPPCGACGDARRTHDAWAAKRRNPAPPAGSPCPWHDGELAARCPQCQALAAATHDSSPERFAAVRAAATRRNA